MITLLVAALLSIAPVESRIPPVEKCAVSYLDGKGNTELKLIPTLHIAGVDARTFRVPDVSEGKINGLMCGRESLIPDPSDWVVVRAGLPFFISAGDRILVLEIVDGRLQARMMKGVMLEEEQTPMQSRIDELQEHFKKDVPQSSVRSKK